MAIQQLVESSGRFLETRADGAIKIVLITPGQGTSAYYTESVLREHGPAAFPKGTHSYPKHEKAQDRNPLNMIGAFVEDAYFEEGIGLVNWLMPRDSMRGNIEEIAPYVGFSINASGDTEMLEQDGQLTKVATTIIPSVTNTVDLVSYAGRGGHFALAESLVEQALADSQTESSAESHKKDENMALEDEVRNLVTAISPLLDEFRGIKETLTQRTDEVAESKVEAANAVDAAVKVEKSEIPESVKESLREGIKAGNYDVDDQIAFYEKLAKEIRESAIEEAKSSLQESYVFGTVSSSGAASDATVKGWAD